MKFLYVFLLALCLSFSTKAQITGAEYFIDADPGIGNGIALPVSGNTIDQDFSIPTTGLSEGIHKMYLRVQHSGAWSLYAKNVFYITQNLSNTSNIASAEYFFNSDPGVGNATPLMVSGTSVNQGISISTTGLSAGIHKLNVRVMNANGLWTFYDKQIFYVNPNKSNKATIASAEYFFDTDPGVGNGEVLPISGNSINENFSISTNMLQEGMHKLYIRTVNADDTWSVYDDQLVYINGNNANSALITSGEYFFDTDPGVGNATIIDLNDSETIDEDLEFQVPNDLSSGDHYLYVRVKNENDTWSLYTRKLKSSTLSNEDFQLNEIKIYPNPVQSVLNIENNHLRIDNLKIINMMGQEVYVLKENVSKIIDIGFLHSGIYLLQLKTTKGAMSKRFIKN